MTINEIKKELYKQKPSAFLLISNETEHHYIAELKDGHRVNFKVPVSDMGITAFEKEMPAQLLIRWLAWS